MSIIANSVHHVSFRVDDLAESVAFYVGVLGCTEIPRAELPSTGAWLRAGSTEVHLIEAPPSTTTGFAPVDLSTPGRSNHVAFPVRDLAQTRDAFGAAGIEVSDSTVLPQLFVRDPSGHVLEFIEVPDGGDDGRSPAGGRG